MKILLLFFLFLFFIHFCMCLCIVWSIRTARDNDIINKDVNVLTLIENDFRCCFIQQLRHRLSTLYSNRNRNFIFIVSKHSPLSIIFSFWFGQTYYSFKHHPYINDIFFSKRKNHFNFSTIYRPNMTLKLWKLMRSTSQSMQKNGLSSLFWHQKKNNKINDPWHWNGSTDHWFIDPLRQRRPPPSYISIIYGDFFFIFSFFQIRLVIFLIMITKFSLEQIYGQKTTIFHSLTTIIETKRNEKTNL